MDDFIIQWMKKEDEIKVYFESLDFNQLFDKILSYLHDDIQRSIFNDNYNGICFEDITDEQFNKLEQSISYNIDNFEGYTEHGFPNKYFVYRGVKFETIYGQGSFTVASLFNPDEIIYEI